MSRIDSEQAPRYAVSMAKRVQVVLEDDEYKAIKAATEARHVTVEELVLQRVRLHEVRPRKTAEDILRTIEWASQLNHPTADIDVMLEQIAAGRNARGLR